VGHARPRQASPCSRPGRPVSISPDPKERAVRSGWPTCGAGQGDVAPRLLARQRTGVGSSQPAAAAGADSSRAGMSGSKRSTAAQNYCLPFFTGELRVGWGRSGVIPPLPGRTVSGATECASRRHRSAVNPGDLGAFEGQIVHKALVVKNEAYDRADDLACID